MTTEELQKAMFILGPWLVGSLLDVMLQGVLLNQFNWYFQQYRTDRLGLRLSVIGLAVLTTLKSVQSVALVWDLFILNFTDLGGAILRNYTTWWQTSNSLMVATIGLYVQIFFCHRLWIVSSGLIWLSILVGVVLLFAYISICLATYYITQGAGAETHIALWFATHLSSVFAGDLLITLSTAFFLLKTKKDVLPQTVGTIDALILLTFQTAAPASICAMFNLVFSQIYSGSDKLISTAFNQVLPKLYAFSMMWTLNARLRLFKGNKGVKPSHPSSDRELSRRRPDPVELPSFSSYTHGGTVAVHTQTEITRHIDFKHSDNQTYNDVKRFSGGFGTAV